MILIVEVQRGEIKLISILTVMQFIVNIMIFIVILSIIGLVLVLLFKDKGQNQHSVLRNYPVLGRVRYFAEKIGPELRQYLFANDTEETIFKKPVHKYCASR